MKNKKIKPDLLDVVDSLEISYSAYDDLSSLSSDNYDSHASILYALNKLLRKDIDDLINILRG
ncbi:MAG: hypothetical protein KAG06_07070 [Methylococcales bacterium]|nr:hypothetical protein [Methylococcales bacterium]